MVNKDWKQIAITQCEKDGAKEPKYKGISILNVNKILRDGKSNKIEFICKCENIGKKVARQIETTGAFCDICTGINQSMKKGQIKWSKKIIKLYF